jgi:predicted RNase H-like HicB family nuclease
LEIPNFVKNIKMKLKIIIHEAEEGGYWAEVPSLPGCASQGESMVDLINNLYDAVEGCLTIDMKNIHLENKDTVMELAV